MREDPKIQKLIGKALKAQRKAIVDAVKEALVDMVEDAKADENSKDVVNALKDAAKAGVAAAKAAEVKPA